MCIVINLFSFHMKMPSADEICPLRLETALRVKLCIAKEDEKKS